VTDHVSVEFESPEGEALRFDWPADALARIDARATEVPWSLSGELDWDKVAAVRVFSGSVEDGGLAIAAIRPANAAGHGQEAIAGVLVNDDGVERLDEILLSTELDGEGAVRRIGLELYRADSSIPLRIAGDATGSEATQDGAVTRTSTAFELRAAGATGTGRLEILSRR
jgi:hypothetical protein